MTTDEMHRLLQATMHSQLLQKDKDAVRDGLIAKNQAQTLPDVLGDDTVSLTSAVDGAKMQRHFFMEFYITASTWAVFASSQPMSVKLWAMVRLCHALGLWYPTGPVQRDIVCIITCCANNPRTL